MLLAVAAACSSETIEVPGETVVVEKVVTETVEVPGETVVVEKEVIRTVEVPGETVTKEVVKEVMVPGETVVVEKEVVKTVEVPGQTVVKEVVKTVEVPGETVVVEKEVVKTVEVPGQTVVVEKVVVKEVPAGYVTDPTTGKAVTAPQYGGTMTYAWGGRVSDNVDPFVVGFEAGWLIDGVNEKLAIGDWALDREEFDWTDSYVPTRFLTGNLAESWEMPDDKTFVFNIRQGVHYALNPDSEASRLVNGRELTADDVVYTYQRSNAQGDFTEPPLKPGATFNLPWESIEATGKYTVVMKLTKLSLDALQPILAEAQNWILPRDVIEQYGNYEDWKNVVGTGPFILTDYVEGVSKTFTKNPDYWGYDEKYPENRLPYIDQLSAVLMAEEATRISAVRTGKVDIIQHAGVADIGNLDVVRSLQKTNPEIEVYSYYQRAFQVFSLNIRNAPFDDVRVRHALQMALDLETINITYFGGFADWENPRWNGVKGYYTPFEEWPEELKGYYTYDPEGAEALLDAAGYKRGADGVRFKVDYHHRDVIDLGYTEIAAGYWAEIGVDVTTNIIDTGTWVANRRDTNYEMSTGDMAHTSPDWSMNVHRDGNLFPREWLACSDPCAIDTSVLDAASDAFYAATTLEEQFEAGKAYDMDVIKQHNQIWGPLAPQFQANHPWVIGFNGEYSLGDLQHHVILARLWIDQELKKAMGY